jgi:hypothetical protein
LLYVMAPISEPSSPGPAHPILRITAVPVAGTGQTIDSRDTLQLTICYVNFQLPK